LQLDTKMNVKVVSLDTTRRKSVYDDEDGVETNLALARHWLQSACTNHESAASNLLERLRQMKP